MTNTRCNGWTNYATWRVNLELLSDYCDSLESDRMTFDSAAVLADCLREYVEEIIGDDGQGTNIACDYALAFVSAVNYDEIAAHYPDLIESDDDDTDEEND